MPLLKNQAATIEDIYNLPQGQRAELIDGELQMMAPPSTRHQMLLNLINVQIYNYIQTRQGKCQVLPAPFAVFLKDEDGQENYVEPDLSVICDPEKLDEKGCHGAPDWVIEIVSPSSKTMDYGRKSNLYYKAGVREYWIVDPMRDMVVFYRSSEGWIPEFARFGEKIKAEIYEDLEIVIQ